MEFEIVLFVPVLGSRPESLNRSTVGPREGEYHHKEGKRGLGFSACPKISLMLI